MSISFKPLNKVHELMNNIGYEPGYAYDDLVFSNDAVFIVQFDPATEKKLKLFINMDCEETEEKRIRSNFTNNAEQMGIKVFYSGTYSLEEKAETKEIDILFNIAG
jgi:hypothetical protein